MKLIVFSDTQTRGVKEEFIIEYHKKGYSISRITENVDVPIGKVMDVLSRLNEESDVDKTLDKIETSSLD
ncbi:MAG: hypothetical protein FIB07_07880 [Candidatus Methanoperedens sp.]|nr:hypothetical protein [Candidatus Methanoperedens sp.]